VLTTRFGDLRSHAEFGCHLWEDEYVIPTNKSVSTWMDSLQASVKSALRFEKRLTNVEVEMHLESNKSNKEWPDEYKKIGISVRGYLPDSQQKVNFERTLLFSPLSIKSS
jgi:hypothetical protein